MKPEYVFCYTISRKHPTAHLRGSFKQFPNRLLLDNTKRLHKLHKHKQEHDIKTDGSNKADFPTFGRPIITTVGSKLISNLVNQ